MEETKKRFPEWAGEKPIIENYEITNQYLADVVIVGGGHAGVQCALAAAEAGISVIVVEKLEKNKMKWLGEQIGHVNSKFLIEQGLGPYDEEEIINEFLRVNGNRVNPSLIASYVHNSGEMMDNMIALIDSNDDILDNDKCNIHVAYGDNVRYPLVRCGYKSWAGTLQLRGKVITDRDERTFMMQHSRMTDFEAYAWHRSEELGSEWHFGMRVEALVQDENGTVGGVIAENEKGEHIRYNCRRAVVLAAGDFSANHQMTYALCDEMREVAALNGITDFGGLGQDGMGQKLGIWAGGRLDIAPRSSMMSAGAGTGLTQCGLTLNPKGKRYTNEGIPGGSITASRLLRGEYTWVTDSKWFEQMTKGSIYHGCYDFGRPEYVQQLKEDMSHVLGCGSEGYPVRASASSERFKATIWAADTLEELAEYLGVAPELRKQWVDSVNKYNELCYSEKDTQFGKDPEMLLPINEPPYFGGKLNTSRINLGLVTLSGLITDDNMNVLDYNDEPIRGLYAVGNCLGNRYAIHYETPIAGNSIGMAMTHGRVLGKYLASLNENC